MDKVKDIIYSEPEAPPKRTPRAIQPHRCAKHVEDFLVAVANFDVQDQWQLVRECMRSEKGQVYTTVHPLMFQQDTYVGNASSNLIQDLPCQLHLV
jgi:hypothetical protein